MTNSVEKTYNTAKNRQKPEEELENRRKELATSLRGELPESLQAMSRFIAHLEFGGHREKGTLVIPAFVNATDQFMDELIEYLKKSGKIDGVKKLVIRQYDAVSKPFFNHFPNLEFIEFHDGNHLQSKVLSGTSKLTHLELWNTDVNQFEPNQLQQLQYLGVYGSLTQENIKHLTQLKSLELLKCPLEEFNINELGNLETLYVSDCNLSSIDLSDNTKLKNLDLSQNLISHLDLTNNRKLERLNVSKNPLDETPKGFEGLKKLKELKMGSTGISNINLKNNPELNSVYLINNENLGPTLDLELPNKLKTLILDGCTNIKSLSLEGGNLRELLASGTGLGSLDLTQPAYQKLERLHLVYNPNLQTTPQGIADLTKLKILVIEADLLAGVHLRENLNVYNDL